MTARAGVVSAWSARDGTIFSRDGKIFFAHAFPGTDVLSVFFLSFLMCIPMGIDRSNDEACSDSMQHFVNGKWRRAVTTHRIKTSSVIDGL